jgi:hypothetical protein
MRVGEGMKVSMRTVFNAKKRRYVYSHSQLGMLNNFIDTDTTNDENANSVPTTSSTLGCSNLLS